MNYHANLKQTKTTQDISAQNQHKGTPHRHTHNFTVSSSRTTAKKGAPSHTIHLCHLAETRQIHRTRTSRTVISLSLETFRVLLLPKVHNQTVPTSGSKKPTPEHPHMQKPGARKTKRPAFLHAEIILSEQVPFTCQFFF